jgi:biopolymer transport protein ExbD
MDLIPEEELKPKSGMNLTPMVDFLFLVVAIFATLAITRTALFDSEVNLATLAEEASAPANAEETFTVNLSITAEGKYKWITEFNEYSMKGIPSILQELSKQSDLGLLPQNHNQTKILLHIDKKAEWDPVMQLIHSLKQAGYPVNPVHRKIPPNA